VERELDKGVVTSKIVSQVGKAIIFFNLNLYNMKDPKEREDVEDYTPTEEEKNEMKEYEEKIEWFTERSRGCNSKRRCK